jgi:PIN domain nuclease of toxin-antitoxin system
LTGLVASLVADLAPHHRDPFDRLLLAQAMSHGLIFHTADRSLSRYGAFVLLIA